jgi:SAM-dependent methyltransferase
VQVRSHLQMPDCVQVKAFELLEGQVPQLPPQPSLPPHSRSPQSGTQATHCPSGEQVSVPVQPGLHVLWHPSEPHSLPAQLGMHVHWPSVPHAGPESGHVPQLPPHPSMPQMRPVQSGMQGSTLSEEQAVIPRVVRARKRAAVRMSVHSERIVPRSSTSTCTLSGALCSLRSGCRGFSKTLGLLGLPRAYGKPKLTPMGWLSTTWQPDPPLARTLATLPDGARVCEVGSGGRRIRSDVVCVDVVPGPNVDIVADAHELPFESQSFDLVVSAGMLNLCRQPQRVLGEFYRILRSGGRLHLEVPMFQAYLPEPEDYWRWTPPGLRCLLEGEGFVVEQTGVHIGPGSALASAMNYSISSMLPGPGGVRRMLRLAAQSAVAPLKLLDLWATDTPERPLPIAFGHYALSRKATLSERGHVTAAST